MNSMPAVQSSVIGDSPNGSSNNYTEKIAIAAPTSRIIFSVSSYTRVIDYFLPSMSGNRVIVTERARERPGPLLRVANLHGQKRRRGAGRRATRL